jgi:hypothetical protein
MIGDAETLLPLTLAPDTGNHFTIPACWTSPPEGFDALIEGIARNDPIDADQLRAEFLCPAGEVPQRTGTPLPVDAPYPEGHPLGRRD